MLHNTHEHRQQKAKIKNLLDGCLLVYLGYFTGQSLTLTSLETLDEFWAMDVIDTILDGVVEIIPSRHEDQRGYFSETFRDDWFQTNVTPVSFVQENQSLTRAPGVLRGLHFQSDPRAQGKLVRCVSGSIFDVAVDIRWGSRSFGKWVGVTLTANKGNQLWVPPGFLHGFCTLEPNCLVAYKVTSYFDQSCDKGVCWNDPELGINWPDIVDVSTLSSKDLHHPPLAGLPTYFTLQEH